MKPNLAPKSRDDLSFTQRDAKGGLVNWCLPPEDGQWHRHFAIGECWFAEVVALARENPQEGYDAMRFATEQLIRHVSKGHDCGFIESMSKWALAGILACDGRLPKLPLYPSIGAPPDPDD